jgi:pilus assembly protein CpaF
MAMMANPSLSSPAVRRQIVSAIDLVVQIEKMPDGAHRITELSEVVSLEQDDAIRLAKLFTFKYDGEYTDATLKGSFVPGGIAPRFLPRLERYGLATAFLKAVGA